MVALSKYVIEQECETEANARMKLKLEKIKENVHKN